MEHVLRFRNLRLMSYCKVSSKESSDQRIDIEILDEANTILKNM